MEIEEQNRRMSGQRKKLRWARNLKVIKMALALSGGPSCESTWKSLYIALAIMHLLSLNFTVITLFCGE